MNQLEKINEILKKSKLTKKDVDEIAHKLNKKVSEDIKKADFKEIFGSLKGKKIGGQKFKDIAREGWEP